MKNNTPDWGVANAGQSGSGTWSGYPGVGTQKKLAAHYATAHSSGVEPHIPVVFMSHSSARLAIMLWLSRYKKGKNQ